MRYVQGEILTQNGFKKGYLGFEQNKIKETGKGSPPEKPVAKGIIVPTFVNAHTHLGDSFIKKKNIDLPRNVEELVAPPHGLKYKLLENASDEEIIGGMEESIKDMARTGISHFCDFREGGIKGIRQLTTAMKDRRIDSVILSRPEELEYNKKEIDLLLQRSDGIGISSISDWEFSELKKVSTLAKQKKKLFALHGSEVLRENIDPILDLKPDFLVHMVKATKADLLLVKDNNIPIVLCPRSNAFFGLKPNISLMKQIGIDIMLGTDNVMINSPNILEELRFLKNNYKELSLEELCNMITYAPRKALNLNCDYLVPNSLSNFVVLDRESLEPQYISTA